MRTTIDLPDLLARKAKIRAVETESTLREIIIRALEKELSSPEGASVLPPPTLTSLPQIAIKGRKPYSLSYEEIDHLLYEDSQP